MIKSNFSTISQPFEEKEGKEKMQILKWTDNDMQNFYRPKQVGLWLFSATLPNWYLEL